MIKRFRRLEMPEPPHVRGGEKKSMTEAELEQAIRESAEDIYRTVLASAPRHNVKELQRILEEASQQKQEEIVSRLSPAKEWRREEVAEFIITQVMTLAEKDKSSSDLETRERSAFVALAARELLQEEKGTEGQADQEQEEELAA